MLFFNKRIENDIFENEIKLQEQIELLMIFMAFIIYVLHILPKYIFILIVRIFPFIPVLLQGSH